MHALAQPRADGFQNLLTKIGTYADVNAWNRFCLDRLTDAECEALMRGNFLAKKVCEMLPKAAFREGFDITLEDQELAGEVSNAIDDLGGRAALVRAAILERGKGGAAILPVTNDLQEDWSQPLDLRGGNISEITGYVVLEARELYAETFYRDLRMGQKFRRPETFRLRPRVPGSLFASQWNQLIHESRLIIFPGLIVADDQVSTNYGFGDSRLDVAHRILEQFGVSWEGVATLLQRIEQGVYSIEGLSEALAEDGEGAVQKALLNMDRLRSLLKMLVIDKRDTYQRQGVPLTGVPDVLELFMLLVCAVVEAPATQVFGMAPKGLNATGESDLVQWENQVAGEQSDHYAPRVKRLVEFYLASNAGPTGGKIPDDWSIQWRPLRQQDEGELADRNYKQAQADEIYLDKGVATPEVIRRNRFGGETYSLDTRFTEEEVADLEAAAETAAEEALVAPAVDQNPPATPEGDQKPPATPEGDQKPPATPEGDQKPPAEPNAARADDRERADHLERVGSRWVVWNASGTKKLGTFRTRKKAVERLRQVEMHAREG